MVRGGELVKFGRISGWCMVLGDGGYNVLWRGCGVLREGRGTIWLGCQMVMWEVDLMVRTTYVIDIGIGVAGLVWMVTGGVAGIGWICHRDWLGWWSRLRDCFGWWWSHGDWWDGGGGARIGGMMVVSQGLVEWWWCL